MNNDPQDIGKWIQDLTSRSMAEQARALERYRDLVMRITRGELNEQTVLEEYMRFARDETTRYVRNLATLSLSYYNALLELTRAHNDRFFEQVLGATANGNAPVPRDTPPQRVEMELHAPVGQDITSSFIVENKRTEMAEISFLVSEFVGPAGTAPFRPPLQLKPPRFTLDPREERLVTLVLPLLPELFTPGQHYRAEIVVRGHDDLELILNIWPDASAPPEQEEVSIRVATPESVATTSTTPAKSPPKPSRRRKATGEIAHG